MGMCVTSIDTGRNIIGNITNNTDGTVRTGVPSEMYNGAVANSDE